MIARNIIMKSTIKNILGRYFLPFVLFTSLGVFSAMLLRNHTSLQASSVEVYMYVLGWSVLIPNIIGFAVLISADWIAVHYPIYYLQRRRLWWHYALVACLLMLTNYATIVLMKYLGHVPKPFSMAGGGFFLIFFIWFVEMIIIGLLLFSKSISYSVSILKEKQKLEAETMAAKYNALQQQLNPHFLFNSLNVLIAEIQYDPTTAVRFTQHLSDIYRYVLKCQSLKQVTVREELEFIHSYLYLHEVRLGSCLTFKESLTEEDKDSFVPPLTLQLLTENVIKHNNISEKTPMVMELYADRQNGMIVFSNMLHPKRLLSTTGHGLNNLSERYKILSGKNIKVEKTDERFMVSLPILNGETVL